MKITYSPKYLGKTTHLAIHHAGGLGSNAYASTINLTAENISDAHKDRWNFPSEIMKQAGGIPWYGGYSFYIQNDGRTVQFRAIGEETAAQYGHNFNGEVLSICFAGNHTINPATGKAVDEATPEQIASFKALVCLLPRVSLANVVPHRFFQKTECYGNGYDEKWAAILAGHALLEEIQAQLNMLTINSCKVAGNTANLGGIVSEMKDCSDTEVRG